MASVRVFWPLIRPISETIPPRQVYQLIFNSGLISPFSWFIIISFLSTFHEWLPTWLSIEKRWFTKGREINTSIWDNLWHLKQHFQNGFQLSISGLIRSLQSNFSAFHSGHTKLTSWRCEFTLVNFETIDYYRWRLQNLNQKIHAQTTSTPTGVKGRQDLKKTGIASS